MLLTFPEYPHGWVSRRFTTRTHHSSKSQYLCIFTAFFRNSVYISIYAYVCAALCLLLTEKLQRSTLTRPLPNSFAQTLAYSLARAHVVSLMELLWPLAKNITLGKKPQQGMMENVNNFHFYTPGSLHHCIIVSFNFHLFIIVSNSAETDWFHEHLSFRPSVFANDNSRNIPTKRVYSHKQFNCFHLLNIEDAKLKFNTEHQCERDIWCSAILVDLIRPTKDLIYISRKILRLSPLCISYS